MATGDSGLYTWDGVGQWVRHPGFSQSTSVACGGGKWIVVTNGGTFLSADDGANWTQVRSAGGYQVEYARGTWALINSYVHFSDDGVNWRQTSGTATNIRGLGGR